jgi:hypothetical protein
MASSINASTAGAGGVITTADNSGVLNLQSGGTTIATVQSSGFSLPTASTINAANTFGFKNRLINGGMTIDQRYAGTSVSATDASYSLDRWRSTSYDGGAQTGKFTVQQTPSATETGYATRVAAGFTNYLAVTSSAATTVSATGTYNVAQLIEGFNSADLAWGTSSAKTVTLSFLVYSSLTGTFGGCLMNSAANYAYPFSYSIPTANTWTQISITVAGPTSGTWIGATNGIGIRVQFSLGTGTTYSGTAGSWSANRYESVTGATSVVSTNGATFYITGVQFEIGSQATSFDFRDYGRELILCQRYYESNYNPGNYPSASSSSLEGTTTAIMVGSGVSGMAAANSFRVYKRTTPTMTMYSYNGTAGKTSILDNASTFGTGTVVISRTGNGGFGSGGDPGAGLVAGVNYWFGYTANAEL